MRLASAICICLLFSGCFSFSPIRMDQPIEPGSVRIRLSPPGAARVDSILGRRVTVIDADIIGPSSHGMTIRAAVPRNVTVFSTQLLYQEFNLARTDVTEFQRRRLNRVRTTFAVAGGFSIAGFMLYRSLSGKTGSTITDGTDGPAQQRLPLLWFSLR